MKYPDFHLAQINIARLRAPLDHDDTKEFRDFINPVNALAADSPGFVWLLSGEDGQSSSYDDPHYEDPMIVVNFSVWETYEDLHAFVYGTVHRYFLQSRKNWFLEMSSPQIALWWVPAGNVPSVEEAKAKLRQLSEKGPGPEVFDLRQRYDPKGEAL